ncbi:MAG: HAD family hydrolase [Candidatus Woesearchaeota archaeon]|nr:MAG: HAD family hydrolase [Candidatus Woesearchaeota archaeon]
MDVSEIEVIGFNWDGNLVNSMITKSKRFAESIIKCYEFKHPDLEKNRKEIEELYLNTRGTLRIKQLELVQEGYNLERLNEADLKKWSDSFTDSYLKNKLPLFKDTLPVLNELKKRSYRLFSCSPVPKDDLDRTLRDYPEVKELLDFVLGTRKDEDFKKGAYHLQYASDYYNHLPFEKIAFVTQAVDDIIDANKVGCFSIARADPKIKNSKEQLGQHNPKLIIENLRELLDHFK